ncbi:Proteinase inhibitor type-2 [Capsicum annuum]|uniref:Proteinase inhibitor type-2 n=1 Tax=Capsicum annuum TaxID=4072 RepID=A0A2G3A0T9_CAPAN|nr:Proteinase inhibitor type-2 [Capsicum annuum]
MAAHKEVSFLTYLLVLGLMFLLVSASTKHDHDDDDDHDHDHDHDDDDDDHNPKPPKSCTKECGNFAYGICPRSEGSPKNPICTTCCAGYKGCYYYDANGKLICEGQSDPRKPNKHCSRNCDPKIAYSKCPGRSEGKTIIKPTGCTTCCTGYKGCYYYGKDDKFVCEGESIEPRVCTQECDPRVAYMTCPSTGSTKHTRICVNCCTAKPGCKLYDRNGSQLCTGDPKNH